MTIKSVIYLKEVNKKKLILRLKKKKTGKLMKFHFHKSIQMLSKRFKQLPSAKWNFITLFRLNWKWWWIFNRKFTINFTQTYSLTLKYNDNIKCSYLFKLYKKSDSKIKFNKKKKKHICSKWKLSLKEITIL